MNILTNQTPQPFGRPLVANQGFSGTMLPGAFIAVPAYAAYSVRLLYTSYTGPCMRVRRSGDNAESDINFNSNGNLDRTALLAFVAAGGGTNQGYVVTWYDQSGRSLNATQGTAATQPRICNAGSVDIFGSTTRPGLLFSNSQYLDTGVSGIAQPFTAYTACQMTAIGKVFDGVSTRAALDVITTNWRIFAGTLQTSSGGTFTSGQDVIMTSVFNNTDSYLYKNGTAILSAVAAGTSGPSVLRIGGNFNGTDNFDGYLSEQVFVVGASSTTQRTTLTNNLSQYYSITVS